jgi:hypothetical protein
MNFTEIEKKLKSGSTWKDLKIIKETYIPMGIKYDMAEQGLLESNRVIEIKNGFATVNRMNYEINLYALFCYLYTNIEFDLENFTNLDCDILMENKFEVYLNKETNNDTFIFSQIFKNTIMDRVREINASIPKYDIAGMEKLIEEFKNIPQETFKTIDKITTKQKGS